MAESNEYCYPGRPVPPKQEVAQAKPVEGKAAECVKKQNGRNGMAAN